MDKRVNLSSLNTTEVPKGYKEITNVSGVYISDNEVVITGCPENDEFHNCDEMECSSVSHVLYRTDIG